VSMRSARNVIAFRQRRHLSGPNSFLFVLRETTTNFITIGQKGKFEKSRSLGEALLVPTRCHRWPNLLDRAFGTLREHTLRGRRAFLRGNTLLRVEGISRNFSRSIVMKFVVR
jgi:hypothetical protein